MCNTSSWSRRRWVVFFPMRSLDPLTRRGPLLAASTWRKRRPAIEKLCINQKIGPKKTDLHSRSTHNLCTHYDLRRCCHQPLYACIIHVIREIRSVCLESPYLMEESWVLTEMMLAAMWSSISDWHRMGRQGKAFPEFRRTPGADGWASWHAEMGKGPQRHRHCHLGGSC